MEKVDQGSFDRFVTAEAGLFFLKGQVAKKMHSL